MKSRMILLPTLLLTILLFASCSNENEVVNPTVLENHPHLFFGKTVQVYGEVVETGINERPVGSGWYKIQNPRGISAQDINIEFRTLNLPAKGAIFTITGMLNVDPNNGELIFLESDRDVADYSYAGAVAPITRLDPMVMTLMIVGAILLVGAIVLIMILLSSGRSQSVQRRPQPQSAPLTTETHSEPFKADRPAPQPVRSDGDSHRVYSEYRPQSSEAETIVVTDDATRLFGDLAWLTVENGRYRGAYYDIKTDSLRVGRGPRNNEIHFDDDKMSREHAIIRKLNGDYVITDRGSSNGTWVNDQKTSGDYPLKDGDVITIGETRMVFKKHSR